MQYQFQSLCSRVWVKSNALAFTHLDNWWKRGAWNFANFCPFGSRGFFVWITKAWFVGEDSEIKILDLLNPNKVGPVLQGRGGGQRNIVNDSKNWVWQKCDLKSVRFTTGAFVRKLMSHQFHRAVRWEFQACCSSCQVNGEISQCAGASPVLKKP